MRRPRTFQQGLMSDPELLARARRGSRSARRRVHRHTRPAALPLALSLTDGPVAAARVVHQAVEDALTCGVDDYTSALVTALHTRALGPAAAGREAEGRRDRAAVLLCDRGGLSQAAAASLLGISRQQLAGRHARGRAELGLDAVPDRCRGWALVSRDDKELTDDEGKARDAHLSRCHTCRAGLRQRTVVRRGSRLGAAGVVGAAAAFAGQAVLLASGPTVAAGAVAVAVAGGLGAQAMTLGPQDSAPSPRPAVSTAPGATPSPAPTGQPALRPTAVNPPASPAPSTPTRQAPADRPGAEPPAQAPPQDPQQPSPGPTGRPLVPGLPLPALPLPMLPPALPPPSLPPAVRLPSLPLPTAPAVPTVPLPALTAPQTPIAPLD